MDFPASSSFSFPRKLIFGVIGVLFAWVILSAVGGKNVFAALGDDCTTDADCPPTFGSNYCCGPPQYVYNSQFNYDCILIPLIGRQCLITSGGTNLIYHDPCALGE